MKILNLEYAVGNKLRSYIDIGFEKHLTLVKSY